MSNYTREQSECAEKLAAAKIDQWYRQRGIDFERVTDEERQWRGMDVILHGLSTDVVVDEKVKWESVEKGSSISAISFEVCRVCRDGYRYGWLVDSDTDVWCFMFPLSAGIVDQSRICMSDELCAVFVQKSDVMQYILQQKTVRFGNEQQIESISDITDIADEMIHYDIKGRLEWWRGAFWMTRSTRLGDEKPVNVVIPLSTLCTLPHTRVYNSI